MADPISIGATVLSAGGSILKGVAANKAGKQNRRAAYAQAREEERTGEAQALRIRDEARRAMGEQIAGQFANGFMGGTGSALDALSESQINATVDMLEVRRQAQAKAQSLRAEGDQARQQGRFALASGILGAASTAVSDWADSRKDR